MKKVIKTVSLLTVLLLLTATVEAQVEEILKVSVPELYGSMKITESKKYQKSEKQEYRDLYYKLKNALQDIEAYKIGSLTDETAQVFESREIRKLGRDEAKMDSLENMIAIEMEKINDYMKWDERLAADSLGAPFAYTTYKDLFKAKKYDKAYNSWKVLYNRYPAISATIYSGGAKLIKMKIQNAKTDELKNTYIDSLFMVYDQQVRVYPTYKSYIYAKKTKDYYNFFVNKKNPNDSLVQLEIAKNYELATKAISLAKEKTSYTVFPIAMKLSLFQYALEKITVEEALENYIYYSDVLNKQYEEQKDVKKKNAIKKGGLDVVDNMFAQSDLSTCQYLVPTFRRKYEANPKDPKNLKKIVSILGKKGCSDSSLYSEVAVALYDLEPSAEYANNLGNLFASKEKYDQAVKFFEEAISKETVDSLKAKYEYSLATVYREMKKYSQAREHCRKSLSIAPNNGKPYILIAIMYAETSGSVGTSSFEHQAVYWVVVDNLKKAKNVDPSVANEANKLINSYSGGYPKQQEGFMQGYPSGTAYTVGGWIGESTKARYNK